MYSVQWQNAYFDEETLSFPFPLLAKCFQSWADKQVLVLSVGKHSFCKRVSACSWRRKLIPQHSLLAAGSTARKGEITGLGVRGETKIRGFAAGSWFFCLIILSIRFWGFAFPSSACVQVCDGLSPHLRKFCREVTTFTAGVKMKMLSGTPTISRPEAEAVKWNQDQSG